MVKWTVVGAGFVGSVLAERIASQLDQQVLLVDRRDHIGGNAFDYINDHGHLVHRYGPHVFHTNSFRVAEYLSQFTEWELYEHRAMASVKGQYVPVPFNFTSIEILQPQSADVLKEKLIAAYGLNQKVPILKLRKSNDAAIRELAEFVYENVFLGYTRKQWGLEPEELDASVLARVPVMIGYDDRYFQDSFQRMPAKGYTQLFKKMLSHKNIRVELEANANWHPHNNLIYTGAIDEFFNYRFGPLEYRSLDFKLCTLQIPQHQPVGQLNFPNGHTFTRTTEFSHLTRRRGASTTIAIEYPRAHAPGKTTPYYPVPRPHNAELYAKYKKLAAEEAPQIIFAGRLADYQYYNMDQAVGRALSVFEKQII